MLQVVDSGYPVLLPTAIFMVRMELLMIGAQAKQRGRYLVAKQPQSKNGMICKGEYTMIRFTIVMLICAGLILAIWSVQKHMDDLEEKKRNCVDELK